MSHPQSFAHAAPRSILRRTKLLSLVATAMVASFVMVPLGQSLGSAVASAATPNCNGNPLGVSGTWTCSFDDEFNGTALNTSVWVPQLTATSGYVTGSGDCYVDNPNTISVSGGYLNLSVVKVAPFSCAPGYMSQYQIGMVSTYKTFDQTYGAFEVRAKIPNVSVAGLQETLWLYPQTVKNKNNTGEIDFAEFYSDYPNLNIPYIHYSYDNSDPNVTSYTCSIDQSQFNTYDVVWTHTTITILDNGQTCLVDKWKGGAFPFNVEHFLALTQAIGIGKDASTSSTPYPDTTQIDYVRAWTSG